MQRIKAHLSVWLLAGMLAAVCPVPELGSIARAEQPAASQRTEAQASSVDLPALFDAVVGTIDRRFVDSELLKSLDWQARARAARPAIVSASSENEAVSLINALLAELHTSHTGLYTPDEFRYYLTLDALRGAGGTAGLIEDRFWGTGPYFPGIGAFTTAIDGRHFVDGVLEGSPADKAGLKFGDEILAVDGQTYSPIAAFRGKIGSSVEIEIRRTRGAAPVRIGVPVVPIVPSVAFSAATKASARIIEKDGRRIGYIHVWAVNETRTFRAALADLDPSTVDPPRDHGPPLDALIVDMRGRVGGSIDAAAQLLDMIGTAQRPYWGSLRFIDRSGKDSAAGGDHGARATGVRSFRGRSAILIDHQTRSAGEIVAYGYQRSGFGRTIGTQTAGAVSSGSPYAMPGGLMLYVATSSLTFDGQRLEGAGVAPDIRVERPVPYAAGADPVLEAAVAQLATGFEAQ
ncbi:S41 family peptidase [Bradyrhizobium sp. LHD-71]|uniref:S41 family peptidase n=1 Tax=Bradyrhizobium sp. LHD-71 TaxID=3072141 RepID=UPI00280CB78F|nr:S41 family peptidase [Bradyrhizobium sp. LHD-71]MDQ8731041.1 S41 family peptidase [Bradyrhizobium sp. LHD-71]